MSFPFFYIEKLNAEDDSFVLNEDASKHIVQVLRMKEGEQLQLTDGKGNLLTAAISNAHKKNCTVVKKNYSFIAPAKINNTIAISLVKNNSRFEWFLEKSTEIGVTQIVPLLCERTEKQHVRFDRMKGIIISAMLQSKQCWMPELMEPTPFVELIKTCLDAEKFIAHCESDEQKRYISTFKSTSSKIILIGPEGDFSNQEIALAKTNGFVPVSLGNTRLRTETAGVVASVLLTQ
jgi:16S rRNA (uracil1498-N3)-methyltransferase